jgi:hypothetical protein
MIGYLATTSADLLAANPQLANLFAHFGGASAYTDALFTLSLTFLGWVAAAYAITATLRLQSEEVEGRADHVLATAVSRLRWAASDLALAVIGSAVLLAAFGLPAGLAYGLSTGNVGYELPRVLVATLAYLPAVWVVAGIAMALYGLVPRLSFVSWGALGAFVLVELIGETLQVSQSVLNISPFNHVPKVLVSGVSSMPLVLRSPSWRWCSSSLDSSDSSVAASADRKFMVPVESSLVPLYFDLGTAAICESKSRWRLVSPVALPQSTGPRERNIVPYVYGTMFSALFFQRFVLSLSTVNGAPCAGKIRRAPAAMTFSQL